MELGRTKVAAWVCGTVLAAAAAAAPAPDSPKPADAGAAPAAATGAAPKITFDKTELDLGDIIRGDEAVAAFTYHNTGTAPLHILSAKPG